MSGAASGLRVTSWNTAPAIPSAAPASRPVSARGSRRSSTMKFVARSPAPASVATTSSGGIENSPSATLGDERRERRREQRRRARSRPREVEAAAPGHSATSFRRRTSQMKNGAPRSPVTIPTPRSAGRATTRPSTSPASSSTAPSTTLYGIDPAVVGAGEHARDVRDGEPDERDRARGRHRAAGEQHEPDRGQRARAADALAERARHVVAERERVQRRARRRARSPARRRSGAAPRARRRRRGPAIEPTTHWRNSSSVCASNTSTALVSETSSAASTAPASARLTALGAASRRAEREHGDRGRAGADQRERRRTPATEPTPSTSIATHDRERRAGVDAEDPGLGERVARRALHQRARPRRARRRRAGRARSAARAGRARSRARRCRRRP